MNKVMSVNDVYEKKNGSKDKCQQKELSSFFDLKTFQNRKYKIKLITGEIIEGEIIASTKCEIMVLTEIGKHLIIHKGHILYAEPNILPTELPFISELISKIKFIAKFKESLLSQL